MISLGLDIGSNSVGSAWVDTDTGEIVAGVSVFPAGVEDSDDKRGTPKNQARRGKRSLRRILARRSQRKRQLKSLLLEAGLLPPTQQEFDELMQGMNPWQLRAEALERELGIYEFGRALVHLNQKRGALGIKATPQKEKGEEGEKDDRDAAKKKEEGAVKAGIDHTMKEMKPGETWGSFMWRLYGERKEAVLNFKPEKTNYHKAIRNRRDSHEFHVERKTLVEEFERIWEHQAQYNGSLGKVLKENRGDLKESLCNPESGGIWREQGAIFGQRKTYWKLGTLGRCSLEPTAHCCPKLDMHASRYLMLESVNNIRILERGKDERELTDGEREQVITVLQKQKNATPSTVRKALRLDKKDIKEFFSINLERNENLKINTDWFFREIVAPVFGKERWEAMSDREKESVNRAIQKFDPDVETEAEKLKEGAAKWWGLDVTQTATLIKAWDGRPKLEDRINYSRIAVKNLLRYMERGMNSQAARKAFSIDTSKDIMEEGQRTPEQRARYAPAADKEFWENFKEIVGDDTRASEILRVRGTNKNDRAFMHKHANVLPPPPMLANPVVRKAIHEVRRHINAYLKKFGRKPDRIVIEMIREARKTGKESDRILKQNNFRDKMRKDLIGTFGLEKSSKHYQHLAVNRVLLQRQQGGICPYCQSTLVISETDAVEGKHVEMDHIIPRSRGGDNGMNNMVLCHRSCNRDKGRKTAKEWLQSKGLYDQLELKFKNIKTPERKDFGYFTWKDFARKWKNLTRDVKEVGDDEWQASQLSDTAYAARAVVDYLQKALYSEAEPGTKQIFNTRGGITAMLRKDWQLYQGYDSMGTDEDAWERLETKDRTDHRHHAVDAIAIALTGPEIVQKMEKAAYKQEEEYVKTGHRLRREPLPPPKAFGEVKDFRAKVIKMIFGDADNPGQIVCHRPEKRRIVGAFHKDTLYGPVKGADKDFSTRISIEKVSPKMLRMGEMSRDENGKKVYIEPALEQSGLVRDVGFRKLIRDILKLEGFNPDSFTPKDIEKVVQSGKMQMRSGVPIRAVTLLRTIGKPVDIPAKDGKPRRIFFGGNNHHIEIIRDKKKGKWSGKPVNTFEAAQRIRRPTGTGKLKKMPKGTIQKSMVCKDHGQEYEFVMSVAQGEIIYAHKPGDAKPTYFVMKKLKVDGDSTRIFFARHNDANKEKTQVRWGVSPGGLATCGPEPDVPPYKVRITPLGEIIKVLDD